MLGRRVNDERQVKGLSQVEAGELVKYVQKKGFKEARTLKSGHKNGSDHHFYVHPDGRTTTIRYTSRKDIIPTGTYKAILKQTELKDFKH